MSESEVQLDLGGGVRSMLESRPTPPPWAGQDWKAWSGHRCEDHERDER